jgi:uncharacterized protein (DUF58 family)
VATAGLEPSPSTAPKAAEAAPSVYPPGSAWNPPQFPGATRLLSSLGWLLAPTPSFWLLLMVVSAMYYAAVSQGNSVAYLIAFTIVSMTAVSLVHSFLMLRRLEWWASPPAPIFSGELLEQTLHVRNTASRPKLGLRLGLAARQHWSESFSVPLPRLEAGEQTTVLLQARLRGRGRHPLAGLVLQTSYPLGVMRLSRWRGLEGEVLVYPEPAGISPLPPGIPRGNAAQFEWEQGRATEGDNYSGVRNYRTGDSQRHVDWKAVARGQPMLVKEFTGAGEYFVWLRWEDLPNLGREARLSQLTRWVMDAEAGGLDYGLSLPNGTHLAPSRGRVHFHRCLAELALFPRN